jgi:ABC-type multidrug transport system ATPase subunit
LAVRLSHFSAAYAGRLVLDDLCLTIPQGGLTAVMGPGGSGKSTLLAVLAGLSMPCDFEANGRVEACLGALRFLPQASRPTETVAGYRINLIGSADNTTNRTAEIAAVVPGGRALFDPAVPDREIPTMALRLAHLHQVLFSDGELILLDEPLAGLEDDARDLASGWIHSQRSESTLVMVTHHLGAARSLADNVALLIDGVLYESAKSQTFFQTPTHPRTRRYLELGS